MSNYTKSTDFAAKDALASGDPLKVIKGSEIGAEYDNLQTAVNSKLDAANGTSTGTLTLGGAINYPAEASIASSGTTSIGAAASNNVLVTGTTSITSFGTIAAGVCRTVRFSGILTLTYNSTSLILPGLSSIITAVNDCLEAESIGSGNWIVRSYTRADGGATFAGQIQPLSATVASNALTITLSNTALDFRSSTLSSGAVTRLGTGSISLVISSGSTLGTSNNVSARIVVLAINNAGTIELAAGNFNGISDLTETGFVTTTAEGGAGAADSGTTLYSTTARTAVPYRVVGYLDITEATAGTWASAPTVIQGISSRVLQIPIINSTASTSLSGTSTDFVGIPAWVKRITISLKDASTNGTNTLQVQLGTGATPTYVTAGYATGRVDTAGAALGTSNVTTGFSFYLPAAASDTVSGTLTFVHQGGNIWAGGGLICSSGSARSSNVAGAISLGAALTAVRISTVAGTDTWDGGTAAVMYE